MEIASFTHAGGTCHGIRRIQPRHAEKIVGAVKAAFELLDDPLMVRLLQKVRASDFDHRKDTGPRREADGAQVLEDLRRARAQGFAVNAGWVPKARRFSRSIARERGDGTIDLNVYKLSDRDLETYAGTFVHEMAHVATYGHRGNHRRGNEATVPHFVGDLARWVELGRRGRPRHLPRDACAALRALVAAESAPLAISSNHALQPHLKSVTSTPHRQRVAISYGGAGVELGRGGTVEALEEVARLAGFRVRRFVQASKWRSTLVEALPTGGTGARLSAEVLAEADLWLSPGSDNGRTRYPHLSVSWNNIATTKLLRAAGYDVLLKDAIRNGLGYVGICAGAYLGANVYGLDLLGARTTWAKQAGTEDCVIRTTPSSGTPAQTLHWPLLAGPRFELTELRAGAGAVEVLATFEGGGNAGHPAAVTFDAGQGRVLLCGPHPEALDDRGWDANGSRWRTTPGSIDRNRGWLAQWMNEVARRRAVDEAAAA